MRGVDVTANGNESRNAVAAEREMGGKEGIPDADAERYKLSTLLWCSSRHVIPLLSRKEWMAFSSPVLTALTVRGAVSSAGSTRPSALHAAQPSVSEHAKAHRIPAWCAMAQFPSLILASMCTCMPVCVAGRRSSV